MRWLAEASHIIGVIPLACLAWLHWRGERRSAGCWLMASGFGVSFLADFAPWRVAQQTYPISQAALVALALLPSRKAMDRFVWVLLFVAACSILARDAQGVDVALRVVAWLGVSFLAYVLLLPGALRNALAYGFAALTLAWMAYVMVPGWTTWGAYQGVRLIVALAWCRAVARG